MNREQLEHVIRAAGGVSGERELIIVSGLRRADEKEP